MDPRSLLGSAIASWHRIGLVEEGGAAADAIPLVDTLVLADPAGSSVVLATSQPGLRIESVDDIRHWAWDGEMDPGDRLVLLAPIPELPPMERLAQIRSISINAVLSALVLTDSRGETVRLLIFPDEIQLATDRDIAQLVALWEDSISIEDDFEHR